MRTFTCASIQDASNLPWVFELPPILTAIPIWGVNILPWPIYSSFNTDQFGNKTAIGEPLYYQWKALLDPADTPLPDWITEITPHNETLP